MQISKSLYHISTILRADYKFIILLHSLLVPLPRVSLLLTITGLITSLGWMLWKLDIAKKIPEIDCVIAQTEQLKCQCTSWHPADYGQSV